MLRALVLLVSLTGLARAADLHVPAQFPSIQAAVSHAQDGDTILVQPGTYLGTVAVLGKAVRIVGVEGPAVTTLGGTGANALILFGSTSPTVVEGLTITGGSSAHVAMAAGNSRLERCRIVQGAGIGVEVTGDGNRHITDCLVSGNLGGGIRSPLTSSAELVRVTRCLVTQNGGPDLDYGGGLYGTALSAVDCVVEDNRAQRGGGGAFLGAVQGTLFTGNTATVSGGGYYAQGLGVENSVKLFGAAFVGNHAPFCGGVHLDLSSFFTAAHALERCLVADNTDDAGNLGFVSQPFTAGGANSTTVLRCTFVNNRIVGDKTLVVLQSILRGPQPVMTTGGNTVAQYSDIEGGWPGLGNIDADPLFVDAAHGVYALTPGSPCVDADSPFAPPDPDGSIPDLGVATLAPFVAAGVPLYGAAGLPGLSGAGTLQGRTPVALTLVRGRPLAAAVLVLGIPGVFAPFKGGVLVPAPLFLIPGLPLDAEGSLVLAGTWPAGMPAGLLAWAQCWIADSVGEQGWAASNGLGFVPP